MESIINSIFSPTLAPVFGGGDSPVQPFAVRFAAGGSMAATLTATNNIALSTAMTASGSMSAALSLENHLATAMTASGSMAAVLSVTPAGGGDYVNSIQAINIDMTGATSNTATISTVGERAFIIWAGVASDDAAIDGAGVMATLTNATTVTATRAAQGGTAPTWGGYVVDATSALVSKVEFIECAVTGGNTTQNFSTVGTFNLDNTSVNILGFKCDSAQQAVDSICTAHMSGTQQVQLNRIADGSAASTTVTVMVQIIEWNAAALEQNVQHLAISGTATTDDNTISSVTPANTILMWGGCSAEPNSASDDNEVANITGVSLQSTTNVRAHNAEAGGLIGSYALRIDVVEFVSGVLDSKRSVLEGGLAGTSNLTATEAVSPALTDASNATVSFLGLSASASTASWRRAHGQWSINSASEIQLTVAGALTAPSTLDFYGELVEWAVAAE